MTGEEHYLISAIFFTKILKHHLIMRKYETNPN
jgi:hypothetical protein